MQCDQIMHYESLDFIIQLILEQHRFELCRSALRQIFSINIVNLHLPGFHIWEVNQLWIRKQYF